MMGYVKRYRFFPLHGDVFETDDIEHGLSICIKSHASHHKNQSDL
jgi:hypothetical protein